MKTTIPDPRICETCGIDHPDTPAGVWQEIDPVMECFIWECEDCYMERMGPRVVWNNCVTCRTIVRHGQLCPECGCDPTDGDGP